MALSFSGTAQYYKRTSTPVTALPFTMACWANLDSTAASQPLMGIDDGGATNRAVLQFQATGTFRAFTQGTGNGVATTTATASAGTWAHGAGVFVSSTNRTAYLNGGNSVNNTTSSTLTGLANIGLACSPTSGAAVLTGKLAECGIWNVALDADEVAALAKGYSPLLIRPASLVFYWPGLRDGLIDLKGAALTATGSPTVFEHPRIIYPRKPAARRFNVAVGGGGSSRSNRLAMMGAA